MRGSEQYGHSYQNFKSRVELPGVSIYGERKGEVPQGYVYAYSGHGTQEPGELKSLYDASTLVQTQFRIAADALSPFGYDFEKIGLAGTKDELKRTEHAHPYILFYNMVCEMLMREQSPHLKGDPVIVIGQSLGFGNAAHRAGVLGEYGSPEALVRLMRVGWFRGQVNQMHADQMAYEGKPSGLLWRGVKDNMTRTKVTEFGRENGVLEHEYGLQPAIVNHEGEMVYGGYTAQIDRALKDPRLKGSISSVNILLDGTSCVAFHTDLMKPVDQPLKDGIGAMIFYDAKIPVLSNTKVPAELLVKGEEIKEELFDLSPLAVRADAQADLLYEHGFNPDEVIGLGKKGTYYRTFLRNPKYIALAAALGITATAVIAGGIRVAQIGASKPK